jgi:hypothetical protein
MKIPKGSSLTLGMFLSHPAAMLNAVILASFFSVLMMSQTPPPPPAPEPSAVLVDILTDLPPYKGDTEPIEVRRARMTIVAAAIESAAERTKWPGPKQELVAAMVSLAVHETHLAQHVHAGKCKPHECDRGRAASLWQIQHGPHIPHDSWLALSGDSLEQTTLAAHWAAHFLAKGKNGCKTLEGAFGMYATGRTCSWPSGAKRSAFAREILTEMRERRD